jgi:hypothetical protein
MRRPNNRSGALKKKNSDVPPDRYCPPAGRQSAEIRCQSSISSMR